MNLSAELSMTTSAVMRVGQLKGQVKHSLKDAGEFNARQIDRVMREVETAEEALLKALKLLEALEVVNSDVVHMNAVSAYPVLAANTAYGLGCNLGW